MIRDDSVGEKTRSESPNLQHRDTAIEALLDAALQLVSGGTPDQVDAMPLVSIAVTMGLQDATENECSEFSQWASTHRENPRQARDCLARHLAQRIASQHDGDIQRDASLLGLAALVGTFHGLRGTKWKTGGTSTGSPGGEPLERTVIEVLEEAIRKRKSQFHQVRLLVRHLFVSLTRYGSPAFRDLLDDAISEIELALASVRVNEGARSYHAGTLKPPRSPPPTQPKTPAATGPLKVAATAAVCVGWYDAILQSLEIRHAGKTLQTVPLTPTEGEILTKALELAQQLAKGQGAQLCIDETPVVLSVARAGNARRQALKRLRQKVRFADGMGLVSKGDSRKDGWTTTIPIGLTRRDPH